MLSWRSLLLMSMLWASCTIYSEDLLEDDVETSPGVGGSSSSMGGSSSVIGTGAGGSGGMATSTSSTSSSTTSTTTTTSSSTTSTGGSPPTGDPWINEIHYDNDSVDADEGVEIAGPAGTSLSTCSLVFYNGSNGAVYQTSQLSGTLSNQQSGYGVAWFGISGIQNGSPDGIALVQGGTVLEFLSYDGTIVATDGPAMGMTSVDLGVTQSGGAPTGTTLQLQGSGSKSDHFTWGEDVPETRNSPNMGQTFP